jgi:hypothetical protein
MHSWTCAPACELAFCRQVATCHSRRRPSPDRAAEWCIRPLILVADLPGLAAPGTGTAWHRVGDCSAPGMVSGCALR